MANQRFLEAFQPVLDSIPHPLPANSTDTTCAGVARRIIEAESVSKEKLATALRITQNPLCQAVELKLMQQLVKESGKSLPYSFTQE